MMLSSLLWLLSLYHNIVIHQGAVKQIPALLLSLIEYGAERTSPQHDLLAFSSACRTRPHSYSAQEKDSERQKKSHNEIHASKREREHEHYRSRDQRRGQIREHTISIPCEMGENGGPSDKGIEERDQINERNKNSSSYTHEYMQEFGSMKRRGRR